MHRAALAVLGLTLGSTTWASPATPTCPVTSPNGLGLPGERPQGNHGDGVALATDLWPDGVVVFKPDGPASSCEALFPPAALQSLGQRTSPRAH